MTPLQSISATILFVYSALVVGYRLRGLEPHLRAITALCGALDALAAYCRRLSGALMALVDSYRMLRLRDSEDREAFERIVGK